MSLEGYECRLPEQVQRHAEQYLHETKENRVKCFREIKNWALQNNHLNIRMEEKYILPFLRGSKFDLEKTKKKIKNFYIMRAERTEWFNDRNPNLSEIKTFVDMESCLALKKTSENCLVFMVKAFAHNPKIHTFENMIKTSLMIMDIAVMEEELSQVYGVIAIIDLKNLSLAYFKQLTVSRIRNLVYAWENYHVRPQKIQFVNGPTYVNIVLDIFKKFMSEKLKKRMFVSYEGLSASTNILDKSVLPKDYGGNGESMAELKEYWIEKLISYTDWFREDEKFKALKKN